jgi:hypothetical protein
MKHHECFAFLLLSFGFHAGLLLTAGGAIITLDIDDEPDFFACPLIPPAMDSRRWSAFNADEGDGQGSLGREYFMPALPDDFDWSSMADIPSFGIYEGIEMTRCIFEPPDSDLDSVHSEPKFKYSQLHMTDLNTVVERDAVSFAETLEVSPRCDHECHCDLGFHQCVNCRDCLRRPAKRYSQASQNGRLEARTTKEIGPCEE